MRSTSRLAGRPLALATAALLVIAAAGCADSADAEVTADTTDAPAETESTGETSSGVRVVSPAEGAAIQVDPPADLVVLDVRTAEEFADGHIDGATTIDFYASDFAARIAELDRDVPYLLYCRSGNRSGQTAALMEDLGFTDVADIDGGILAWSEAGFGIVQP